MVTGVLANSQFCEAVDGICLLLDEIGGGNKKSDFLFKLGWHIQLVLFFFELLDCLLNQLGVIQIEYLQDQHDRDEGLATPCGHEHDRPKVGFFLSEPLLFDEAINLHLVCSWFLSIRLGAIKNMFQIRALQRGLQHQVDLRFLLYRRLREI